MQALEATSGLAAADGSAGCGLTHVLTVTRPPHRASGATLVGDGAVREIAGDGPGSEWLRPEIRILHST